MHLENCTEWVEIVELIRGQATKGAWWMPWRREPKKGVASDEMPRVAASRR